MLIRKGHANFTTRAVAQDAGIALGNLTYHFQSRSQLLQALIHRLLSDYSSQFEQLLPELATPIGHKMEPLVRWLMVDSTSEDTVRIFRELWALSLHDEEIREAVDEFYDVLIALVVKRVHRSRPHASVVAVRELVHVLALLTEGSAVLYGMRAARKVPLERIVGLVAGLLDGIAPPAAGESPGG